MRRTIQSEITLFVETVAEGRYLDHSTSINRNCDQSILERLSHTTYFIIEKDDTKRDRPLSEQVRRPVYAVDQVPVLDPEQV